MKKVLWFDPETTGIDPARHGIIQFGGLVEVCGEVPIPLRSSFSRIPALKSQATPSK